MPVVEMDDTSEIMGFLMKNEDDCDDLVGMDIPDFLRKEDGDE